MEERTPPAMITRIDRQRIRRTRANHLPAAGNGRIDHAHDDGDHPGNGAVRQRRRDENDGFDTEPSKAGAGGPPVLLAQTVANASRTTVAAPAEESNGAVRPPPAEPVDASAPASTAASVEEPARRNGVRLPVAHLGDPARLPMTSNGRGSSQPPGSHEEPGLGGIAVAAGGPSLTLAGTPAAIEPVEYDSLTRTALEWIAVVAGALVVALVIKTVLFQAFVIPSESMEPTLGINDRVVVNKLSYQLHDVQRGDVVVFERPARAPGNDDSDLIKRVVGLPGETIEARNGEIFIDGARLDDPSLAPESRLLRNDFGPVFIGESELFVMGDNRNNSRDSREFGPIDQELLIGRAFVIIWPLGRADLL